MRIFVGVLSAFIFFTANAGDNSKYLNSKIHCSQEGLSVINVDGKEYTPPKKDFFILIHDQVHHNKYAKNWDQKNSLAVSLHGGLFTGVIYMAFWGNGIPGLNSREGYLSGNFESKTGRLSFHMGEGKITYTHVAFDLNHSKNSSGKPYIVDGQTSLASMLIERGSCSKIEKL